MIRKPMNIFLHFLNKDTQEIYGFRKEGDFYTRYLLKKGLNAAVLLCDAETYCFLPLGFWFESRDTRELLIESNAYIKAGSVCFSAREETIEEFIEKKRMQYSHFKNTEKTWGIYQSFYEESVLQQLIEYHPVLIDRTAKIGEYCSGLWIDEHRKLIMDNSGELQPVYENINDIMDRNKIANGIVRAAVNSEDPFVWKNVEDRMCNYAIRDKSVRKGLRIYFEKNYYGVYLNEYQATNLHNFYLIDKGINFNLKRSEDTIADYRWFETFLSYLQLEFMLDASAEKIVKAKKTCHWALILQTYIDICNYADFAEGKCVFDSACGKVLKESNITDAVYKMKEFFKMEELNETLKIKPARQTNKIGQETESANKMDMPPLENLTVDVLIMIATVEEENSILQNSEWEERKTKDGYVYFIRSEGLYYALARSVNMGIGSAASAAQYYVSILQPRFLAMAGFCAGKKGNVNLGDVIVPDKVFTYSSGKQISADEILPELEMFRIDYVWKQKVERFGNQWRKSVVLPRPVSYEMQYYQFLKIIAEQGCIEDIGVLKKSEQLPNINKILNEHIKHKWLTMHGKSVKVTKAGEKKYTKEFYLDYAGEYKEPELKLSLGALATGDKVLQYDRIFQSLEKSYERKTYALDMEGYAIADIAKFNHIPYIIAKGVGDFANQDKKVDNDFITYSVFSSYRFLINFFNSLSDAELLSR